METMEILGITKENKDVDMILIIGKEGMDYFFNRLGKISEEECEDQYYYFKQYFTMYLFNSDIWDITTDEQFEILAKHKLNISNINLIIDLLDKEYLYFFWDNLLNKLDLLKMKEFLGPCNAHEYYINHNSWNNENPLNTLLFKKLIDNIEHIDSAYEIILSLLKTKNTKKIVIKWIVDLCKNANIKAEPVLSFDNIIDILDFSKIHASNKQDKYNKNTLVYFNILKIFIKLFDNGIKTKKDILKINKNYIDKNENEEEEEYNFLTTLYFNLHKLVEKCYLFKYNEIKQRKNYIDEIEYEIELLEGMQHDNIILINLADSITLEKERIEFLKKEISFRKNPTIGLFYYLSTSWINCNVNYIKTNSANNIISNILQFFLEEKINGEELEVNTNYSCDDIFMMCLNILYNQNITSDPYHKINSIYIYFKNMEYPSLYKNNFSNFYSKNSYKIYEANINTFIFLKDKLDDYGDSYKLHIYNSIITLMDYANFQFNINSLENEEIFEKFISILIEIINSSFEYLINNIKCIKKIQDEDKDLTSNEIEQIRNKIEISSKYFKNNLNYINILSSSNFEIMTTSIIVKQFSNSLCYILDILVGSNKKNLSIKDKETYGFHPLTFLKIISEIFQTFACSPIFIDVIGKNYTYNSPKLIQKFLDILSKKGELYQIRGEIISQFQSKIQTIKELEIERDEIDIPDEFCDPIMQTLIETPVILPNTDIYMDREVICRHLLTEETNPFNRESLSIKILDEFNSQENIKNKLSIFKRKIENWKKEINF
jgi:hypothetical protein